MKKSFFLVFCILILCSIAGARIVVTGRVTDSDGKPLLRADVTLTKPPDLIPFASIETAKDGTFQIDIDSSGIWILRASGVLHNNVQVALYIKDQKSVDLRIGLGAYPYLSDFGQARVIGDFNNWSILSAVPMRPQPDGTYQAVVASKSDSVAYRLRNVRKGENVEGTLARKYDCTPAGVYSSVTATRDGKATIVFDPGMLPRSSTPSWIKSSDEFVSKFAQNYLELLRTRENYVSTFSGYMISRGKQKELKFDWSDIFASLEKRIHEEENPSLREELCLEFIDFALISNKFDDSLYAAALHEISPASRVWVLIPHDLFSTLVHSGLSADEQSRYVEQILASNPEIRVKSSLALDEFMARRLGGEAKRAASFYDLMMKNYAGTPEQVRVHEAFPHEYDMMVGKQLPEFLLRSMDDTSKIANNKMLSGKYFLMDFWSAASPVCVGERKYLETIYRNYKERNFQILSMSLDSSRQEVMRFRRGKWKMPWFNAYVGNSMQNIILKTFQVIVIPKLILVDPKGTIIAISDDPKANGLDSLLSRLLVK
ncbi:MAG TPA: thioredoxin-like domain-containing protein [Candidatus Kryptonia bacterium]